MFTSTLLLLVAGSRGDKMPVIEVTEIAILQAQLADKEKEHKKEKWQPQRRRSCEHSKRADGSEDLV